MHDASMRQGAGKVLIDQAKISVRAGNGGSGIISFRREKFVPKGGPDGGDGGKGGDVILCVDPEMNTLQHFRHKRVFKAASGRPGGGADKTGKSGADLYIPVPPGTVVKNAVTGEILADLIEKNQTFLAARGGRGGRGNARFATPTNRTPHQFEPGEEGEARELELVLKLIADIGLVGLPNAGKSTLLSRISNARPRIADFPFTTLTPHLGIVSVDDKHQFVAADLPGLIAGAHTGKGLGIRFLKHIERTRVLAILIDCTDPQPRASLQIIENELREYDPALLRRPRLTVLTKVDLLAGPPDATLDFDHRISSVTGEGIENLILHLWSLLREQRR
jgi:GTP-binding protein